MKKENKTKMLLRKIAGIAIFAIALFSVILVLPSETKAANFRYEDFEWDSFYEQNKKYWDQLCSDEDEEDMRDKCEKKVLKQQKKFYTRLYKLLAKYEAKGLHINDNIIIETVFYNLLPSNVDGGAGAGDGEDYNNTYDSYSGAFQYDDNLDDDNYNPSPEFSEDELKKNGYDADAGAYFKEETDTLKLLIENMIAYDTFCYGIVGDPTEVEYEDEEGNKTTRLECQNGGSLMYLDYKKGDPTCASQVGTYELGFWEYYVSKYAHDKMLNIFAKILFFGLKFVDDPNYQGCINYGGGYQEMYYDYGDLQEVSTYKYFEFLKNTNYYDKKAHLQEYYKETVLEPAGALCMTKDVCGDKSLEAMGKTDEYQTEIYAVRSEINMYIIDILNQNGIEVDWPSADNIALMDISGEATRNGFWWPIGSATTEMENGVLVAKGDPSTVTVTSPYGNRVHPIQNVVKFHHGIDIAGGGDGIANVIASAAGTVVTAKSGCTNGDSSCGGGYGNYVVIAHNNGDYTLYAHLNSVKVTVNDAVIQGQVIGKMGTTGSSTGPHLHFEIRQGGNAQAYTVDPLSIVSPSNPRPAGAAGDFSVKETSLTREEFMQKLANYCTSHSCGQIMQNTFVLQAGTIYDKSIEYHVNPELVVVRAVVEGFSPHEQNNSNNYWGIACYNGQGIDACARYDSLEAGIKGFANVVSGYSMASDMMSKYAYIGAVWYNPGSWSLGGCKYFPYIKEFMSPARQSQVQTICESGPSCNATGDAGCTRTTSEDQQAYATWQVNEKMAPLRYNIFGL